MRKAFTLIEILLSLTLLSIVLITIPKIIYALNEDMKFSKKEEALVVPMALIRYISSLPWDENDTKEGDVLLTKSPFFQCDTSFNYVRIGSFSKDRNCRNLLKASLPGKENDNIDDLDDYNGKRVDFVKNRTHYRVEIKVNYLKDDSEVFKYDYNKKEVLIDLSKAAASSESTNLKEIKATLSEKSKSSYKNVISLNYIAANIGEILIRGEEW